MTKIPILTRFRATTIRATTDILQKPNRQQELFPAAALRICDHHLHSSGIIPHIDYAQDNAENRIYEHDWFCVSQAVQCYTDSVSALVDDSSPPSFPRTLLHRVVSGTDQCYCDVWVDTGSIGKSSIQFGGLVSIGHDVLAVVRRVFVRMNTSTLESNSEESGGHLKSAPFSIEEKQRFRESFGFEALGINQNYKASDLKKIQDLVQIKRPDFNSGRLKTIINELESSSLQPSTHQERACITKVTVGPQHINFGNHADHAFLAETAFHALTISTKLSCGYVSMQYSAEVFLGDILESYGYREDEAGEEIDSIILVATRNITGEKHVVLIAQSE